MIFGNVIILINHSYTVLWVGVKRIVLGF